MKKQEHSDYFGLLKLLKNVIFGFMILIIIIIIGFLLYINNKNSSSYTDIDSNGVYNLIDSEGNVIATDLTPEDIEKNEDVEKLYTYIKNEQ